jgi:hypothetical protein
MGLTHAEVPPPEEINAAMSASQSGFDTCQGSIVAQVRRMVQDDTPTEQIVAFFLGAIAGLFGALGSPWFESGGNRELEALSLAFARGAMRNHGPCHEDGSPFQPEVVAAAMQLANQAVAGSG